MKEKRKVTVRHFNKAGDPIDITKQVITQEQFPYVFELLAKMDALKYVEKVQTA